MKGKRLLTLVLALLVIAAIIPAMTTRANAASYEEYIPYEYYPESTHDYANNLDVYWEFNWPGASALYLTFSYDSMLENNFDFIYIYNKNGVEIASYTGDIGGMNLTVSGDTFYIRLVTDSSVTRYGFSFANISAAVFTNGWTYQDGNWYYYYNGTAAEGWMQLGGVWYYFDCGKMATGWLKSGGKWYYMNNDGYYQIGWQKLSGVWYYFGRDGAMYENCWLQSGSNWYYFRAGGAMATGVCKVGNTYYKFSSSGIWIPGGADGWARDNGNWQYIAGGRAVTGWKKIDGAWYYFNANGYMLTGWQYIGGKEYYLKSSGAMAIGWCKIDGDYRYFDSNGYMKRNFWLKDGGKWYYLDSYGYMATYWWEINGDDYFFNADGSMKTGWLLYYGDYYYFNSDGVQQYGKVAIGGKYYCFNPNDDGAMATNFWYREYTYTSGYGYTYKYYYFGGTGEMVKNQWLRIGGYDYYFNAYGECDRTPIGVNWVNWYY